MEAGTLNLLDAWHLIPSRFIACDDRMMTMFNRGIFPHWRKRKTMYTVDFFEQKLKEYDITREDMTIRIVAVEPRRGTGSYELYPFEKGIDPWAMHLKFWRSDSGVIFTMDIDYVGVLTDTWENVQSIHEFAGYLENRYLGGWFPVQIHSIDAGITFQQDKPPKVPQKYRLNKLRHLDR